MLCNQLPQAWWLQMITMYSVPILQGWAQLVWSLHRCEPDVCELRSSAGWLSQELSDSECPQPGHWDGLMGIPSPRCALSFMSLSTVVSRFRGPEQKLYSLVYKHCHFYHVLSARARPKGRSDSRGGWIAFLQNSGPLGTSECDLM